ncbi:MAG: chromate efflux transporter [Paracoccaceae bacterium]
MTHPSRQDAFAAFTQIGLQSFGGPAAQISLMHRVLVEQKGWLSEKQFLNALSFCMLLPGPEAMQLATYAGWRLHGITGGLMAGLLFVLPGAAVIFALAAIYTTLGEVPLIETLFLGIKAAVLIIVLDALLRLSKKALERAEHWWIALFAFVAIFFLSLPFPLIILGAALFGMFFSHAPEGRADAPVVIETSLPRTMATIGLGAAIWLVPIALLAPVFGATLLAELGAFFSKLAVVTFGGAYAVLAYMAQDVVTEHGWLTAGEMLDGLGLAETTPGPLILVTQFVGYLAAFREGGVWLGIGGGLVALWATFIPCFLWIFAGAPYIEWIGAQPRLKGAFSAITAAVVGVILNLSIWFALHVFFADVTRTLLGPFTIWVPDPASLDPRVLALSALCAILLLRLRLALGWVLVIAASAAVLLDLLAVPAWT